MSEINVVPYIDVMLVLLVIFMITAPLLTQGVKVDLVEADAKPIEEDAKRPLLVTRRGRGELSITYDDDKTSRSIPNSCCSRAPRSSRTIPASRCWSRAIASVV